MDCCTATPMMRSLGSSRTSSLPDGCCCIPRSSRTRRADGRTARSMPRSPCSQVPAEQRPDAHISVWLSPTAYPIVGEPQPHKLKPTNTVDAQFSVYFQFAAAWLDGHVDSGHLPAPHHPDIARSAAHRCPAGRTSAQKRQHRRPLDAAAKLCARTVVCRWCEPANWIERDRSTRRVSTDTPAAQSAASNSPRRFASGDRTSTSRPAYRCVNWPRVAAA